MRKTVVAIVAVLYLAPAATAKSHSRHVSRANVHPWPLTVKSGTVKCTDGSPEFGAVLFSHSGRTYAVNGIARSRYPHMAKIDRIWRKDSDGLRVDISGLINAGLKLC